MMNALRAGSLAAAVVASMTAGAHAAETADAYPSRPIRLIVPFSAGGGLEIVARAVGQKLTEAWGQNIVIDNRPGAGTVVGTEIASRAAADGYTLLMITTTFAINPSLRRKLPYDTQRDFQPVTQLTAVANVLLVYPKLPAQSIADLIRMAKAAPGKLSYASAGAGTSPHLAMELLKSAAGIDLVHVPYKGIPPAVTDVTAGRVGMLMTTTVSAGPHIRSGRLRPLAVTSAQRVSRLPDVPAVAETVPGYEVDALQGMVAPAGLPAAVLEKIWREVAGALKAPDVAKRLTADGAVLVGSRPEAFAQHLRTEMAKWAKVVEVSGARVD